MRLEQKSRALEKSEKQLQNSLEQKREAELSLHQKAKFIQLLQEITVTANEASTAEEALQVCLEKVCNYMNWPVGHVYIIASKGNLTPSKIWHIENTERFETLRKVTEDTSFDPGVGLPGRVLATGKPAWITDVAHDQNFPRAKSVKDIGIKAAFALPVLEGEKVVAVLEFFSNEAIEPDELTLEALSKLAVQVGRVTERKKAEESVRESEEKFRSIAQTARDAIISADWNGNIIFWNKGARIIFGYQKEEVLGKPLTILMPKKYRAAHNKGLKRTATTGKLSLAGKTIELHGLRKNNNEFPLEVSLGTWKSGEEIFYSGILRDITERNQVEAELAKERQHLEQTVNQRTNELRDTLKKVKDTNIHLKQANQAKSRFLSSMSHELRTPLNGILGFTDLLQGQFFGKLNEKQLDYVNQIDESGKHLLSLINDLLDVTKIDAGAMELEMEEIQPEEFIEASVVVMISQVKKKKINVKSTIDPDLAVVTADIRRCNQIMLNLLSNALKYTPEGGRVEIRVARDGDSHVRVEVSDSGIGIKADDIEKIFSEFHQAAHVREEQLGGTGIGLALTRRLVELHEGKIGVKSEPGKGSTFWFTLPVKKALNKTDNKAEEEHEAKGSPSTGRRILVAEDNKVNLKMILDMLSIHNHNVKVAKNGQEAIELAQSFKPELILMDIRMPLMNGMEATKRLRTMPGFADTPIIALTASTGTGAEERQIIAGCTAHLAKPIQTKELFETPEKYLKV